MRFSGKGRDPVKRARGWRAWAAAAFATGLALAASEGVLRACGYGYRNGYLRPFPIAGKAYSIGNPDFFRAYFPPGLAPYPEPIAVPADKAPDAYRIFILGESAALGIPEPSFGFGRILERRLRQRYPGIRFEVINLSVTAVNSHVLLPIARAAAAQAPDLFIVYMGHNEVIGPYGPGTVFAPFASGTALLRAAQAVKATRTGQLLEATLGRRPQAPRQWAGMEMFLDRAISPDDPRLNEVYANFRKNLEGIVSAAKNAGARVLVSTTAANLRDNAPFASRHRTAFSTADSLRWNAFRDSAAVLAAAGKSLEALGAYDKAIALDPAPAEPHFREGRLLLALGRIEEADRAFQRALDADALRFRADSRLNAIVREIARGRTSEGIWLADADGAFRSAAADHAPGNEFFYEHVHLRFAGNDLLARTLVPYVDSALIAAGRIGPGTAVPPLADAESCRASLALTGWNALEMAKKILALAERPPFAGRSDGGELRARLHREVDSLSRCTANDSLEAALAEYQRAIASSPEDLLLRRNLGEFFYACDYLPQAAERFREALEGMPHDTRTRQMLAKSLAEQGDAKGAEAEYVRALEFTPSSVELRNGLANALAAEGEFTAAVREYRLALEEDPDRTEVHYNLSKALTALGRIQEAAEHLDASHRLPPAAAPENPEIRQ